MTHRNAQRPCDIVDQIIKILCVGLVLFSLYTALFGVLPDIIQRGVHISIILLLVYLRAFSSSGVNTELSNPTLKKIKFTMLGSLAALAAGYQFLFYDEVEIGRAHV